MLVLSRKAEEKIAIGSDVVLTVMAVKGNRVTIGIKAPKSVRVLRSELMNHDPMTHDPVTHDTKAMELQYSYAEA